VVRGNRAVGQSQGKEGYLIRNQANAVVEDNQGFTVEASEWVSARERRQRQEAERKKRQEERNAPAR
jgi:hypothetical protein